MRIWLDDKRPMPENYDVWVKDGEYAMDIIETGKVTAISFDHDLGEGVSGYDVACAIEYLAYSKRIKKIKWSVHSLNPAGRARIISAMNNADAYWNSARIKTGIELGIEIEVQN